MKTDRLKDGQFMAHKKISKVTIRQAQDALKLLFPSVQFVVAPNGLPGLWVKDPATGSGMRVSFSAGDAGVSVTLGKFAGCEPVTVTGNSAGEMEPLKQVDAFEVTACVYRTDEYSQAFKRWYGRDAAGEITQHPKELGLVPMNAS